MGSTNNELFLCDLFDACRSGDLSKIKQFVNLQNINARDASNSTFLHVAAGKSN